MSKPLVYVCTINWNGLEDTLECLQSLSLQDYPNYKVGVVDNGSKDNQADKIKSKFPNIDLICNDRNMGFPYPNNQLFELAREAGAAYVMLINNDAVVEKDLISKFVELAENNPEVGMFNPIATFYDSDQIWFAGAEVVTWLGSVRHLYRHQQLSDVQNNLPEIIDNEGVNGACLFVPMKVIDDIGNLDSEYFAYFEDIDWGFRARKAGYRTVVATKLVIRHKVSASANRGVKKITPNQARLWGRNGVLFAQKNLTGWRKYLFIMAQSWRSLIYIPRYQNIGSWAAFVSGVIRSLIK